MSNFSLCHFKRNAMTLTNLQRRNLASGEQKATFVANMTRYTNNILSST